MRKRGWTLTAVGVFAALSVGALALDQAQSGQHTSASNTIADGTVGADGTAINDSAAHNDSGHGVADTSSRENNRFSLHDTQPAQSAPLGPGGAAGTQNENDAEVIDTPPLPECTLESKPVKYADYDDWDRTLLDYTYELPEDYAPKDLVSVSRAGVGGRGMVREFVIPDLKRMAAAADKAGAPIEIQSAYRSYHDQLVTFEGWVAQTGEKHALTASARAGHSEHQLGTSMDVRSAGSGKEPWSYEDWAATDAGKWMLANSWKYGFILSYPKGESDTTCYMYEAWHFRYVGIEGAREIHDSGVTLREYLWDRQN